MNRHLQLRWANLGMALVAAGLLSCEPAAPPAGEDAGAPGRDAATIDATEIDAADLDGPELDATGPGDGSQPGSMDTVKVHYHGTLRDGGVFDSSLEREPVSFSLAGVVPCFSEGIQKMKVGGKSKLVCPSDIAYGERGFAPMIPPGTALQFEVELLDVIAAEPAQSPAP